jgi:hypothetical protein
MNDRIDAMEGVERVVEKEAPVKIVEREIVRMIEKEKVQPGKILERDDKSKDGGGDKKPSGDPGKTTADKK